LLTGEPTTGAIKGDDFYFGASVRARLLEREAFASAWAPQWRTFLTRERMAAVPEDLEAVIAELRAFLMPLAERALSE